jgi:PAT family beta-lactamase induction signal transducer AmpG
MFALTVIVFIAVNISMTGVLEPLKTGMIGSGIIKEVAGFITGIIKLAISTGSAGATAWLTTKTGITPTEMAKETYLDPVMDFIRRYGKAAVAILALISVYRISDILMGVMANVFYTDLGFSKQEIAAVSQAFGPFMTITGSFLGGLLSIRYGVIRILFLGALLSALTNVLFAFMAHTGPDTILFVAVIIADNLSAGLATAAFIAYLSGLTDISFTAMQYAIFSSIMTLFPKILAGYSGTVVDSVGYSAFFIGTAVIGIPVLYLVVLAGRITAVEKNAPKP